MSRLLQSLLLIAMLIATGAGAAEDWRTVLSDDFETRTIDPGRWINSPPEAGVPDFDARDGGVAVHLRAERSNRSIVTMLRPLSPYRLSFDFMQPATEAGGYRLVVHHPAQGGEVWWFELDKGEFAVWTTHLSVWAPRWTGGGLNTDAWYRLTVEDEPERVRLTVRDVAGAVAAQSEWIAHDGLGEPGGVVFDAASGGGLRGCLFDNVQVEMPTTAALHRLTSPVDLPLHEALARARAVRTAARLTVGAPKGLQLQLDEAAAAREVTLDGKAVLPRGGESYGGFYALEVGDGRCHRFTGSISGDGLDLTCPPLKLRLQAQFAHKDGSITITGKLRDETRQDRALLLYYVLPIDAGGWDWGDSLHASRPIAETGRYHSYSPYGLAGATGRHLLSPYAWGTLSSPERGLMVARPLDWPRLMSWCYDFTPERQCLVVRTELGLSPATLKFPSQADFRFVLSRLPRPEWGMRAAAQRYYDLYPEFFVKRCEREGLWTLWVSPKVTNPEDFALVLHEQEPYSEDRIAFDDANGGYSFTYSEPAALWQRCTAYDGRSSSWARSTCRNCRSGRRSRLR